MNKKTQEFCLKCRPNGDSGTRKPESFVCNAIRTEIVEQENPRVLSEVSSTMSLNAPFQRTRVRDFNLFEASQPSPNQLFRTFFPIHINQFPITCFHICSRREPIYSVSTNRSIVSSISYRYSHIQRYQILITSIFFEIFRSLDLICNSNKVLGYPISTDYLNAIGGFFRVRDLV